MTHLSLTCGLAAGLLASSLFTTPALASSDLSAHVATQVSSPALLGDELDNDLAAAIEARVTRGKTDRRIAEEFSPGVAKAVRHAYAASLFRPVWTRRGADDLIVAADTLYDHGIVSEDVFERRLPALVARRFDPDRSPKARAKADLDLTLALLRAAQAISGGLGDEGGVGDPTSDTPPRSVLTDMIGMAGRGGAAARLETIAPAHEQYGRLRRVLADYRVLHAGGGWPAIPDGEAVAFGDTDPRISALRRRLAVEGFLEPGRRTADLDLMDADLEAGLKRFQRTHGLESDGVLGGNTLEALNESAASKVDRIAEAMHRWRHQGEMGKRYIWANIPSYTAAGYNNGVKEIEMRTVVGKPRHATPVFSDRAEYMVANPKWYVPISIARRQKVPKLRKDAGYAARKGYAIYDRESGARIDPTTVDWFADGVSRKYRFVQDSGPANALGEIKIIFPNQYSVYLHDTPTKSLFDRAQRAFSSGCVRLQDAAAMSRWIAGGDDALTPGQVTDILETDERARLDLDQTVPVHITYYTVTVDETGQPTFHRDVYDRLDGIRAVERMADLDRKTADTAPDAVDL